LAQKKEIWNMESQDSKHFHDISHDRSSFSDAAFFDAFSKYKEDLDQQTALSTAMAAPAEFSSDFILDQMCEMVEAQYRGVPRIFRSVLLPSVSGSH
jgi:hypothetical protein